MFGHEGLINDMQMSKESAFFVTASKDHTAKLFLTEDLNHIKTYKTERPVNSAAISPIRDHVSVNFFVALSYECSADSSPLTLNL